MDGLALMLMGALQQVLVVDDGHRAIDHSLAAELAELGYASVTASLEAAHDVLAVIARPAAILLQTSSRRDPAYAQLSERLREQMRQAGIPVIVVDEVMARRSGTFIDLQSQIGPYVLNQPDL
jgi:ethanolamine utilization protein EutA (predicted chaperonin)